MLEVEIKAKIDNKDEILTKIDDELNAGYVCDEIQHDIYFNAPDKDYRKTDEALRIRYTSCANNDFKILTYKGSRLDKKTKTREEIEVNVDNIKNMILILEKLGFKKSAEVDKNRVIFEYKEFNIAVDSLKKIGDYMEIESIVEDDVDIEEVQNNIFDLFNKLGITDGFEKRSYLELLES
ncbi:MAG: class IV adenylate cyclase [Methanobacteriaceae archaeon]|nr:class IV adenylate cyclase [Methanobacteriaceae archaeon]